MAINTLEEVIEQMGAFGPFQTLVLIILNLAETPCAWAILLMAFAGATPKWTCQNGTDVTNGTLNDVTISNVSWDSTCDAKGELCGNSIFQEDFKTVVSQWQLVCDRHWLPSITTTVQMVGVMIGAILAGILGDNVGRKKTFFLFYISLLVTCFITAFANSWLVFTIIRFFVGASIGGVLVANYSLPMEFVGRKWRTLTGAIPFWAIGVMSLGLAAYLLRDWRQLSIATSVIGIPLLFTWWFVPESVRWLVVHERFEEAEAVIRQVAKWNKRPVPDLSIIQILAEKEKQDMAGKSRYSYLDLFSDRTYIKKSLVLGWIWFNCGMVFYGLSFGVKSLAGSRYLNMFISGSVEVPAVLSVIYFNNCVGRRVTALVYSLISGIASLSVIIAVYVALDVEVEGMAISGLAMAAKLGIAGAWISIQVFTAESYPTCVRNLGYGYSCTLARIGSILAPSIVKLGTYSVWLPYLLFSIGMISSGLAMLTLPETNNNPLTEYLHHSSKHKDSEDAPESLLSSDKPSINSHVDKILLSTSDNDVTRV